VADVLTKGLPRDRFQFLRARPSLVLSPVRAGPTVAGRLSKTEHSTSMEFDLRGRVGVI